MSTVDLKKSIIQCKQDVQKLSDELEEKRGESTNILEKNSTSSDLPKLSIQLKIKKILKAHFGKIYALDWAKDSIHVVSASQDGRLIVWDAKTQNKIQSIPLRSSWVMASAYAPSGKFVSSGGLDNVLSIWKVKTASKAEKESAILKGHNGYLSGVKYLGSDNKLVTCSGDSLILGWDVETQKVTQKLKGHSGDVMSLSVIDDNTVLSGSCDAMAKLWDLRESQCVGLFPGHESDVNSVDTFPDGKAFGTGSDDNSCKIFDIRSFRSLNTFIDDKNISGVTSVSFSKSGRILFSGYDGYEHNCYSWDAFYAKRFQTLQGHEARVSSVKVSPDGHAICTGSWDCLLKIWA